VIPDAARALLDIWFEGAHADHLDPGGQVARRWFSKNDQFDTMLRERFGDELELAQRGELGHWCGTPRGTLAFILLCDQLSRNCFRGSPRSFSRDALALSMTLAGLARGDHESLTIPERLFFLMPLMHSESLAMHDIAEREYAATIAAAEKTAPGHADWAKSSLDYERRHRAILEKWGRYPHRNAVLGRASTPEEIEFLKQPGSSF
jgi:uncharacterized protein (DUF924 family)